MKLSVILALTCLASLSTYGMSFSEKMKISKEINLKHRPKKDQALVNYQAELKELKKGLKKERSEATLPNNYGIDEMQRISYSKTLPPKERSAKLQVHMKKVAKARKKEGKDLAEINKKYKDLRQKAEKKYVDKIHEIEDIIHKEKYDRGLRKSPNRIRIKKKQ